MESKKKGEEGGREQAEKRGADLRMEKRGDAELLGKATEEQPRSPRSPLATEERKRDKNNGRGSTAIGGKKMGAG
jgi:hypothetical protein